MSAAADAVEDFFVALGEIARAKDVSANGPNPPLTHRSLHDVSLTMHEILIAMRDFLAREGTSPVSSPPTGAANGE